MKSHGAFVKGRARSVGGTSVGFFKGIAEFPFLLVQPPNTFLLQPMAVRHSLHNFQRRRAFIVDFPIEKLKMIGRGTGDYFFPL